MPVRDPRRSVRAMALLGFVLEYGPFVAAGALLVLASLASEIPAVEKVFPNSRVGIYVILAFLALLPFIVRLTSRQSSLEAAIQRALVSNNELLGRVRPVTESVSLAQAFRMAEDAVPSSVRIRIFAITSRFISQQMTSDAFRASRVDLMLGAEQAESTDSGDQSKLLGIEVRLAIEYSWASRIRNHHIDTIRVRQYTFFPTEWYVIFDDALMVIGTYLYDGKSIGCTATPDEALVVWPSGVGREMIDAKIRVFDALWGARSSRVGTGALEGEYTLQEGEVVRRVNQGDWRALPPISQAVPIEPVVPHEASVVETASEVGSDT
ncbi:MAG TPA: hypothetical protein VLA19_22525 [Herpetosiphonaceae bacterium]|nr:hypothetical protein [Herpetosiphonaceae bacterium]